MKPQMLRLRGITHADRHDAIQRLKDAILDGGGFILDFKMFSNMAASLSFEVSAASFGKLRVSLVKEEILDDESLKRLQDFALKLYQSDEMPDEEDIKGTLNITFVHKEPDLRIEVPPIPG